MSEKGKLNEIRGWLLVLILILTIFSPLYLLYTLKGQLLFTFVELIELLATISLSVLAGIFLWAKKPYAVQFAKVYLITSAIIFIFASWAFNDFSGMHSLVGNIIWTLYLYKSKRVKVVYGGLKEKTGGFQIWPAVSIIYAFLAPIFGGIFAVIGLINISKNRKLKGMGVSIIALIVSILIFVMFIGLGALGSANFNSVPEDLEEKPTISDLYVESPEVSGKAVLYFPFWDHTNISYKFSKNHSCERRPDISESYEKIPRVEHAFQILYEETGGILSFFETKGDADITISCYNNVEEFKNEYVGEGYIVGTAIPKISSNGKIGSAEINFFREFWGCFDYPTTELHEILHTFGLADLNDPNYHVGIMYNGFAGGGDDCANLDFDKVLIKCLKAVYSNGEKGSVDACLEVPNIGYSEETGIDALFSSYCTSNIFNCEDFNSHAEAQDIYNLCGGLDNDIHHLDSDGNGMACETLP